MTTNKRFESRHAGKVLDDNVTGGGPYANEFRAQAKIATPKAVAHLQDLCMVSKTIGVQLHGRTIRITDPAPLVSDMERGGAIAGFGASALFGETDIILPLW